MAESWNVGRTGWNFQCRVRAINGLFCKELQWQQMAAEPQTQKRPAKPAFSIFRLRFAKLSTDISTWR
jgi:hypothetical protein